MTIVNDSHKSNNWISKVNLHSLPIDIGREPGKILVPSEGTRLNLFYVDGIPHDIAKIPDGLSKMVV